MTFMEVAAIIVCGYIGYLLVSVMMGGNGEKPPPSEEWYHVLGVSSTATLEEIQAAYRAEMAQYHPDKIAALGPEQQAMAEEESRRINQAYEQALKGPWNK